VIKAIFKICKLYAIKNPKKGRIFSKKSVSQNKNKKLIGKERKLKKICQFNAALIFALIKSILKIKNRKLNTKVQTNPVEIANRFSGQYEDSEETEIAK
jgi:hypothetical protein